MPDGHQVMSLAALDVVLAYKNDDVVSRFADDHNVTLADAAEIFTETKRWLWITAKGRASESEFVAVPLFNEAYAIDMMWHTFILFTQDYADFCARFFGAFIHHQPKSQAETLKWRARIESDPEGAKLEREQNLRKVYEYLYDEVGPEILVKWCEDFPARFKKLNAAHPC